MAIPTRTQPQMRGLPHIAESFKIEIFEARSRDCSKPVVANSDNGQQRVTPEAFQKPWIKQGCLFVRVQLEGGALADIIEQTRLFVF